MKMTICFDSMLYFTEKGFRSNPPRIASATLDGNTVISVYVGVKDDEIPTGLALDQVERRYCT